jgi:hypothetical protein
MTRRDARWAAQGFLAALFAVDVLGAVIAGYIVVWTVAR